MKKITEKAFEKMLVKKRKADRQRKIRQNSPSGSTGIAQNLVKSASSTSQNVQTGKVPSEVLKTVSIDPKVDSKDSKNTSFVHKRTCSHYGFLPVFTIRGVSIYASSRYKLTEGTIDRPKLFLNCTGTMANFPLRVPRGFEGLNEHVTNDRTIDIDWRDGDSPDLMASFWRTLPDVCLANGWDNLTVYCLGSHGRTGTALASLAIANLNMNAVDAIAFVRKNHCLSAVESYRQFDYLDSIAGWAFSAGYLSTYSSLKNSAIDPSNVIRSIPASSISASPAKTIPMPAKDAGTSEWLEWAKNDDDSKHLVIEPGSNFGNH